MTTDITELAQREKFEAWAEEAGALPWGILGKHRKQDGNYPGPHYTYMWKAWQAASAELVEALEKALETIAFQQGEIKALLSSLESRTVKLPERHACELGYNAPDPNGDMLDRDDVIAALTDAGIKWEAE